MEEREDERKRGGKKKWRGEEFFPSSIMAVWRMQKRNKQKEGGKKTKTASCHLEPRASPFCRSKLRGRGFFPSSTDWAPCGIHVFLQQTNWGRGGSAMCQDLIGLLPSFPLNKQAQKGWSLTFPSSIHINMLSVNRSREMDNASFERG